MRVNGVVERLENDYAWVDVSVAQGCGRCQEPGGCGGVNIARPFGGGHHRLRVRNAIAARVGDAVGVEVDDGVPLAAALRVYAWPVLGLLAGAACGTALASAGSADLLAGLGGAAGFVCALLLGRRGPSGAAAELHLVAAGSPAGGECAR